MANWKDITSYRRGDKERIPTAFELKLGVYRLVVVYGHIDYKGQWTMSLYPLLTYPIVLPVDNEADAKTKAIEAVKDYLTKITEDAMEALK